MVCVCYNLKIMRTVLWSQRTLWINGSCVSIVFRAAVHNAGGRLPAESREISMPGGWVL